METIRCSDCYEENPASRETCSRCGRILENRDHAKKVHSHTQSHSNKGYGSDREFEWQHADAPNVMSERNRPKKATKQNTVW